MSALALQELAQAIGREHQAAVSAARSAVEHAIKCGELLLKAKATVGHGGWLAWVETNCTFGQRTAQGYMRLARELPRLDEANAQRVADLSLRDALGTLARQSADLCRLPQFEAVKVLDAADDDERLRDSLVRVVNGQRQATREHDEPSEWTTVELPPSLPPPDAKLLAVLVKEVDSQNLPPMVVLELLNALYCRIQNQHQLITPVGLPAPFEALEAELTQSVRTAELAGRAS